MPFLDWLRGLFAVKGSTAFAIAIIGALGLGCYHYKLFYVDLIPDFVPGFFALLAIAGTSFLIARFYDWIREKVGTWWDERTEARLLEEQKQNILKNLDTLSPREREILAYLLTRNQRSLTTDITNERLATLKQKGLIIQGSGVNSIMDWPHTIPDYVWDEMHRRKEQFTEAREAGSRPPWVVDRIARI